MIRHTRPLAFAIGCAIAACAAHAAKPADIHEQLQIYLDGKPEELKGLYTALFTEGERNAVLNFNRVGLGAMQAGHYDLAERAFDASLSRIEQIYSNDPQAQKAKSKFAAESVKDFKGEPYERALAYYYRGLLYLRTGDYENARASFIAGEYQDTVAEKEEYSSDFDSLVYLAGWASRCANDPHKAKEYFDRVSAGRLTPAPDQNLLLIADVGTGPVKVGTGKHSEVLEFRANTASVLAPARFTWTDAAGSREVVADSMTDVLWQATTRGGRPIQGILNGKAQWKSATAGTATTLAATQQITMQAAAMSTDLGDSADLYGASAVAGVLGLFAGAVADAMKPAADTRFWETLPNNVHIGTATRPADLAAVNLSFSPGQSASGVLMKADAGPCAIVWGRSDSAFTTTDSAPNSQQREKDRRKVDKANRVKDGHLRAALLDGTL